MADRRGGAIPWPDSGPGASRLGNGAPKKKGPFAAPLLRLLLLLPALLLVGCEPVSPPIAARVVGVKDGDTIVVVHENTRETIRLAEIDCPEKKQAYGSKAKLLTSRLAFGQEVTVYRKTRDRYGRTVAAVTLPDGRDLGEEIVKAGLGWQYRKYSTSPVLRDLERAAREARLGLWADPDPIPPWDYRHSGAASGSR